MVSVASCCKVLAACCPCGAGCNTRFWLAFLAVLQFTMCLCTYFSPIAWLLGPFAFVAMVCVFVGIFFRWRRGLQIFMGVSCLLFLLSLVPLITLSNNYNNLRQYRPHRITIFSLELVLNGLSFMVCGWVMCVESKSEDHGEKDSLLLKAKQQGKAVIDWRPPKSWV